jgi:glycosyltransferase involved in cell wall biosynthesis
LKILHLPTSVGGNSWGLAQAEKALGLNSEVLVLESGKFSYPYDISLEFEKKNKIAKLTSLIGTFFKIHNEYDVYHFNSGRSLLDIFPSMSDMDIMFYKGKKIFTFNGCDIRQKDVTENAYSTSACQSDTCYNGICNNIKTSEYKRKKINKIKKYADHLFFLNPDLGKFLPENATFLPYTIAAWDKIKEAEYKIKDKIYIAHAPTDRSVKGTDIIINAVNKLSKKYPIELVLIENVPNEELLKRISMCHLLIDQIRIGRYGALSVEAMKMGVPVAVFIRDEDLKYVDGKMSEDLQNSVINVDSVNIEEILSGVLENIDILNKKRESSLDYVHFWHNPLNIAKGVKEIYERV